MFYHVVKHVAYQNYNKALKLYSVKTYCPVFFVVSPQPPVREILRPIFHPNHIENIPIRFTQAPVIFQR